MPEQPPQTFANHTRLDPPFHFFALPVFFLTFLLSIWKLIKDFSFESAWMVVVALAAVVAVLKIRTYSLRQQDRIIRLEERLRLAALLPESSRGKIPILNESQLIALRFASDAEVPALKQLIKVYEKYEAPVVGTMQVAGQAISRFGVLDVDEVSDGVYKIKDMVEKPPFAEAPSDLAIIGRYVLTPDIFAEIEHTAPGAIGEIQITDAMRSLLKKRPFYAVRFEGIRHDAGDKLGFLIANVEFALKRPDLAHDFRDYLRSLKLE